MPIKLRIIRRALTRSEVISIASSVFIIFAVFSGLAVAFGFEARGRENVLRVVRDDRRYFSQELYDAASHERNAEWDTPVNSMLTQPALLSPTR